MYNPRCFPAQQANMFYNLFNKKYVHLAVLLSIVLSIHASIYLGTLSLYSYIYTSIHTSMFLFVYNPRFASFFFTGQCGRQVLQQGQEERRVGAVRITR